MLVIEHTNASPCPHRQYCSTRPILYSRLQELLRRLPCVTLKMRLMQSMPEFCTCGTQLVPDSLFCHKCGRPTREIVVPDTQVPNALLPAPPPPRPEPPPLNFHNGVALRTALVVAISATLLFFLPYLNWLGAGFFAVFLPPPDGIFPEYGRRHLDGSGSRAS